MQILQLNILYLDLTNFNWDNKLCKIIQPSHQGWRLSLLSPEHSCSILLHCSLLFFYLHSWTLSISGFLSLYVTSFFVLWWGKMLKSYTNVIISHHNIIYCSRSSYLKHYFRLFDGNHKTIHKNKMKQNELASLSKWSKSIYSKNWKKNPNAFLLKDVYLKKLHG